MRFLLDTNVFVWLDTNSSYLSNIAHQAIADVNNELFLSLISIWEMQIKYQLGKLHLRLPVSDIVADQQQKNKIQILTLQPTHIYNLANLPDHHKDPFDRLLIAQAMIENLPMITRDAEIVKYAVQTVW